MGYLASHPMIYNTMQLDGVLKDWDQKDVISILKPLENLGYSWDIKDSRMRIQSPTTFQTQTPWSHCEHLNTKHCGMDHTVLFNNWRIIHPRCLECWKVVVTPTTFTELLQLEEVENMLRRPSKCGIELRDYTPKFYGGYFYNNSLDEGRECYEVVRDAVRDNIGEHVAKNVLLKRGCTEYEMVKGPSMFWHNTPEEDRIIQLVETFVDVGRNNAGQNKLVKDHVRFKWAVWAHMNGDMSYTDFNGGRKLFPDYVKYHEGEIDDIKHDLAISKAHAKKGINLETADEFLRFAQEFAKKYHLQVSDLTHILGTNESNPMGVFEVIDSVPTELKGEHDTEEIPVKPNE